jgi:hypothetical protein
VDNLGKSKALGDLFLTIKRYIFALINKNGECLTAKSITHQNFLTTWGVVYNAKLHKKYYKSKKI